MPVREILNEKGTRNQSIKRRLSMKNMKNLIDSWNENYIYFILFQ